jgi:NAD(P)-dependent dehydrogenase (short-subunit alcohol dehydrogenase family)
MRAAGQGRIVNVSSPAAHPRLGVRLWSIYTASKAALSALSLDLLKEVGPLGIEVVLLEGGVAGHTPIWEELRTQSEHFAGTAYALSEKVSRGQILATTSGPDPLPRVAAMVADACIVPDPGIRFPPENQVPLDSVDRLPDETFARLARAETDPELYEGVTGLWALQPRLLA